VLYKGCTLVPVRKDKTDIIVAGDLLLLVREDRSLGEYWFKVLAILQNDQQYLTIDGNKLTYLDVIDKMPNGLESKQDLVESSVIQRRH
jgi:hypothetical protein